MKKFEEMKKDNKGFSLVELIVVIAIMVVLVAVLGSTILGYVDKSKYSKDVQALDSVKTAVSTYVADGKSEYTSGTTYTLAGLMSIDSKNIIKNVLAEVFNGNDFNNSSSAFKDVTTSTVYVQITNGAVYIEVASSDTNFENYTAGVKPTSFNTTSAVGPVAGSGTGTGTGTGTTTPTT